MNLSLQHFVSVVIAVNTFLTPMEYERYDGTMTNIINFSLHNYVLNHMYSELNSVAAHVVCEMD